MKKKMKFEKMQNYWKEKKKLKKQQKKEKANEKKEITEKDGILYFTIIIIEVPSMKERESETVTQLLLADSRRHSKYLGDT